MSAGTEIGDWSRDECAIVANGSGSFLIRAEDDELHFTPESGEHFAAALNGLSDTLPVSPQPQGTPVVTPVGGSRAELDAPGTTPPTDERASIIDPGTEPHSSHHEIMDGPEPGSLTVALFYLLAALTALLGLWAAVTLII